MTYCSSCGRSSPDDVRFCAHCGIALARPVLGYETPSETLASPLEAARPRGRVQDPVLVLVFTLITLGVYSLFWWWRITKEADAYSGRAGHAHGAAKAGILTLTIAGVVFFASYGVIITALVSDGSFDAGAAEPTPEQAAALAAPALLALAAALGLVVGQVLFHVGKWRVWRTIQDDERARGVASPLAPGLMLFFVLMPYVSMVTLWIAYYRTQKGLNGMWQSAPQGPVSPPPYAAP